VIAYFIGTEERFLNLTIVIFTWFVWFFQERK